MDYTLLRKLTRKSILGFGKYTDLRVSDMLALRRTRELRWIYYNCSKLTFMDDILDEILIHESYRITKPGKDSDLHLELNAHINESPDKLRSIINNNKTKKKEKRERASKHARDRIYYSKGSMARRNQGH